MLLRRRLAREQGFAGHRFSYPTVRGSMDDTVERLRRYVANIEAERIHFVGHSFGGVVLCRYFQKHPCERPGRVVILGSPLNGSRSAKAVARNRILRRVIGPLATVTSIVRLSVHSTCTSLAAPKSLTRMSAVPLSQGAEGDFAAQIA